MPNLQGTLGLFQNDAGSLPTTYVRALADTVRFAASRERREGYSPHLDLIDAERNLLYMRFVAIQVETERLSAILPLYRAMGDGWRPPSQDVATPSPAPRRRS